MDDQNPQISKTYNELKYRIVPNLGTPCGQPKDGRSQSLQTSNLASWLRRVRYRYGILRGMKQLTSSQEDFEAPLKGLGLIL